MFYPLLKSCSSFMPMTNVRTKFAYSLMYKKARFFQSEKERK